MCAYIRTSGWPICLACSPPHAAPSLDFSPHCQGTRTHKREQPVHPGSVLARAHKMGVVHAAPSLCHPLTASFETTHNSIPHMHVHCLPMCPTCHPPNAGPSLDSSRQQVLQQVLHMCIVIISCCPIPAFLAATSLAHVHVFGPCAYVWHMCMCLFHPWIPRGNKSCTCALSLPSVCLQGT